MQSTHPTPTILDEQIKEKWRADTQREWSDEQKVAAWRKWGRINIAAQQNATTALLNAAQLAPGMRVIDIAGGGGDPGLAAAALVGPNGHVTVTDISEGMLETARQFARQDGLTNLDYHVADTDRLPFADHSFDRALCRCAVMFFPDLDAALREIRRVLKPGGRAAFLAWGPLQANPLFSGTFAAIGKVLSLPQPPPEAPHPFRFATPGSLGAALEAAGYREVSEQSIQPMSRWDVTPEQFTDLMVEVGGLEWLLSQMTQAQRADVLRDITNSFRGYQSADAIEFPLAIVLATGIHPLE
jgi:ubiquinone/menaquinone biosynthesis C-methylase UbiE